MARALIVLTGVAALGVIGIYQEHYGMLVQLTSSRRRESSSLFFNKTSHQSGLLCGKCGNVIVTLLALLHVIFPEDTLTV